MCGRSGPKGSTRSENPRRFSMSFRLLAHSCISNTRLCCLNARNFPELVKSWGSRGIFEAQNKRVGEEIEERPGHKFSFQPNWSLSGIQSPISRNFDQLRKIFAHLPTDGGRKRLRRWCGAFKVGAASSRWCSASKVGAASLKWCSTSKVTQRLRRTLVSGVFRHGQSVAALWYPLSEGKNTTPLGSRGAARFGALSVTCLLGCPSFMAEST